METPRFDVRERIERLKALRKRLGWSEEFCAYQLGVTYSTLNRWERGEAIPRSRAVLSAIDRFITKYSRQHLDAAAQASRRGRDHAR